MTDPPDTAWMDRAACRGMDVNLFFPEHNDGRGKAICERCPVREDCLTDADYYGDRWGIRGGVSLIDRKRVKIKECPACGDPHTRPAPARFCSDECAYTAHVSRNVTWTRQNRPSRRETTCLWCADELNGDKRKDGFCSWVCRSSHAKARTRRLLA